VIQNKKIKIHFIFIFLNFGKIKKESRQFNQVWYCMLRRKHKKGSNAGESTKDSIAKQEI